jgi:hypothetical protein
MELIKRLAGALAEVSTSGPKAEEPAPSNLQQGYLDFLNLSDGGYTADHFFHLFGRRGPASNDLFEWNRVDLWKANYLLDSNRFVFAENIFGFQYFFDIRANRKVVNMLDPATGKIDLCTNSFEDFIEDEVFSDEFNSEDRELAEQFYEEKRIEFKPFTHIACEIPILLGGKSRDPENLELIDSLTNLSITGQIVRQVRDLPPGTSTDRITFKGWPPR